MKSHFPLHHVLSLQILFTVSTMPLEAQSEDLNSAPVVTAWAWAISDATSGEILWEHDADVPHKTASTAKTVCAYTVLRLAEKNPALYEEWIAVTELASSATGSSAELEAGESVQVKDCLMGLLLPSGNDAGNALAEHFNARLAPPDAAMSSYGIDGEVLATRVNFIAEMNRHAREIGMKNTIYRSAFGDGGLDTDRTTTAHDLSLLAFVAMKSPVFRQWVATRRHTAVIRTKGGGTRETVWENSNSLLALDLGYDGVKTGVTNQAGHCIIASGQRGTDRLHVVVLGSTSEASRDADARNLFRWAWRQRE